MAKASKPGKPRDNKAWDRDIAGEYEPRPPDPTKPKARVPHWIPLVISRAEVAQMLASPDVDELERLFLRTLYGSGIRATELAALEHENIDTALGGLRFGERVALLDVDTIRALAELDWKRWIWGRLRKRTLKHVKDFRVAAAV